MPLSKSLSLCLVVIMMVGIANKVAQSQTVTTSFEIETFTPGTRGLTFERDAFVSSASTYASLVATDASGSPRKSSVGRVLYSNPIKFWEAGRDTSFQTTLRLRVKPFDDNPADGMTFFIIPVNSTRLTGGEGGNLGIYNAVVAGSPIFAVEFDVFQNAGDPDYSHIGINTNSNRLSQNVTSFESMIGGILTARINYDGPTRRITVVATYGQDTATVSYVYDLTTLLPQEVQVGVSASTGPNSAAFFDLFSWNVTSSLTWDGSALDTNIIRKYDM